MSFDQDLHGFLRMVQIHALEMDQQKMAFDWYIQTWLSSPSNAPPWYFFRMRQWHSAEFVCWSKPFLREIMPIQTCLQGAMWPNERCMQEVPALWLYANMQDILAQTKACMKGTICPNEKCDQKLLLKDSHTPKRRMHAEDEGNNWSLQHMEVHIPQTKETGRRQNMQSKETRKEAFAFWIEGHQQKAFLLMNWS